MDWLFKEDNYIPKRDNDRFIDKSISSVIGVLSRIRRDDFKKRNGIIYRLNPALKLLFAVLMPILLSLSRGFMFPILILVWVILNLLFIEAKDVKKIISMGLFSMIITAIMLLPSMLMGNVKNSVILVIKVMSGVTLVNIMSFTTPWRKVTRSLKLLFIPDIFIFVLDVAIRYIYLLGEISLDMLYALKVRSIGRNENKYSSISGLLGNLFLKSNKMGDEMFSAMECRGFTGQYKRNLSFGLGIYDILYICFEVILIALWIVIGRC